MLLLCLKVLVEDKNVLNTPLAAHISQFPKARSDKKETGELQTIRLFALDFYA